MTKHDIATQGKSITKQRIPSSVMTQVMPTTLQATDWETFLVRIGIVKLLVILFIVISKVWPS
jgi:hypothetical protein